MPAGGIWICRKRLTGGGGMEGEYNIYRAGPRDLAEIWPLWCQMYQELDQYSLVPIGSGFRVIRSASWLRPSDSSQVVFVAKRVRRRLAFLRAGNGLRRGFSSAGGTYILPICMLHLSIAARDWRGDSWASW